MGLSPMVEDVKPDSEICRLDYDSQLFRFSNILSVVCFISHVIQTRAMQNVFVRTNGPYFKMKIEKVPFDLSVAVERYLKSGSGHAFAARHF